MNLSWHARRVRLDSSLIGQRLTVRYRLDEVTSDGPTRTDVVGFLRSLDDATAQVEKRDGSFVQVPIAQVEIVKVVPQRPLRRRRASRASAQDLQAIAARGWPGTESVALGSWQLFAADGFTMRANSAHAHGDPGCSFSAALQLVVDFYHGRGLPAAIQVVTNSDNDVAGVAAGWRPQEGSHAVMRVLDLHHHHADPDVRVSQQADDSWLRRYSRVDNIQTARQVLEAPTRVAFLSLGEPISAIGRVVVSGEWAGLSSIEVEPTARGAGLGTRIAQTALALASEAGADKAYAQVQPDNSVSMQLFDRLGFADHHEYRYLRPPDQGSTS